MSELVTNLSQLLKADVADPDRVVELLGRYGEVLLAALGAEELAAAAAVVLPPAEPELGVAAHAGGGGVVGNPQRRPGLK